MNGTSTLLSSQAYDLVKRDIIQCRLRPGEEVSEAILANRYSFGKAPIRAALSKLSQDGLIHSMPRRGYVVAPITIRHVQEMYELRMILEPAAARAAIGHIDVEYLRSLCKELRYSNSPDDNLRFLETHHEFHATIAKASGNERLTRIVSSLLNDMARLIHFGEFAPDRDVRALSADHQLQQQQHEAIAEALAAGDPDLVQTVMHDHIEHSLEMVKQAVFATRTSLAL